MSDSVLVVDEDPVTRVLLGNALSAALARARVTLLGRGDEALSALEQGVFDVALLDAEARAGGCDAGPLWHRVARARPHLPLVLIGRGQEGDPPPREDAVVFRRPLSIDAVTAKVAQSLDDAASGELHGIGLPAFLQLVEIERKTCAVVVHGEGRGGSFFFDRGTLSHAVQGELTGESAAIEMLCWPRPHILVRDAAVPRRNVATRLSQLLLEAFRLFDERALAPRSLRASDIAGDAASEEDLEPPLPPCTEEELAEVVEDLAGGLVVARRTGRILMTAGGLSGPEAEALARGAARALEAAVFAAAPAAVEELVSHAGDRSTLVWPSARAPATLIVLVMKRSNTAFALAGQRLRARGW